MKRNINIALALAVALTAIIFGKANAEPDKMDVYTQLMEKFSDLKTISLDFNSLSNPSLRGQLRARKGGSFNLKLPGRTIISDGKTIWNYVPSKKQATVSTVEGAREGGFEDVFFSLLKRYQPVSLKKEVTTRFGVMYALKLEPGGEEIKSVDALVIKLDEKSLKIKQLAIERNDAWETWFISDYKLDENFPESEFKFIPPKGTELIDLR
ncbi:MAG: LolA family protein [Chloroflexota bacterium]